MCLAAALRHSTLYAQMMRVREFTRFHQTSSPLRLILHRRHRHARCFERLPRLPPPQQVTLLQHFNIFKGSSKGCLRALAMRFRTTHGPPGDTLVHAGDLI
ncbi:hypothetical protein KUCAC02_018292 [Chaenocephalus aceratus]|uniref:Uncharacterized protein n=1 Tax=Chaenocephalus aceratus TaxID=36190 RepID=A0ACB9W8R8_CHAAC|nr:hypothetical protein KUCAC02_018292 [Chaenocephalus aceratus]